MIQLSTETQLLMVAVFFYIYDACQLLFVNEGIITGHRKNWVATTNKNGVGLLGKRLFIPNLLLPHQPIYRLAWHPERIEQTSTVNWKNEKTLYSLFTLPAYGMAVALFIITPVTYYRFRTDEALLWCLGLIYYFSLVVGVGLYLYRKQLGLSSKQAISIFTECLCCPPFTINIVRKLSLSRPIRANFVESAFQLVDTAHWANLQNELVDYIDEEIEETDLEDKIAELEKSKGIILGMVK